MWWLRAPATMGCSGPSQSRPLLTDCRVMSEPQELICRVYFYEIFFSAVLFKNANGSILCMLL